MGAPASQQLERGPALGLKPGPDLLPLSVGKSRGDGGPAGGPGPRPQLEAVTSVQGGERHILARPLAEGPQAQMAKAVAHVWKSVESLAGGQEKYLFWGFCQAWR